MLAPAFRPPIDSAGHPAWMAWLDANRLTPAAARVLSDASLPRASRTHLQDAHARARAQWLLYKTALIRLLALMRQAPAQKVILLKGAALALTLYDDPAARSMNDIDLLVGPDHLMAVVERMRKAGYEERSLGAGADVGYLHHFIFTDPVTEVRFEIHRTLPLLPHNDDLALFLSQTQPGALEQLPFLFLTPEAQLLHLASHAVLEHGGARGALAIWFYDIDQLIRKSHIDWQKALSQARNLKWEAALHEALKLTRHFFQTPLPTDVEPWLDTPKQTLSGYQLYRSMTSAQRSSSLTIFHILRGLSWRQRWRQVRGMLLPDAAYMHRRYPNKPLLFTYPYRWLDGARKLLAGLRK